jgi:hydrogenase maturation protease
MSRILIIAYGNPLRSDDAVAWRAAEMLRTKVSPDHVEIRTLHQLGPELADSIRGCELVVFVDAASAPGTAGEIQIADLTGAAGESTNPPAFYHSVSPAAVLGLAQQLYGAEPRTFCATVIGENFSHGEGLSPRVQASLPALVRRIEDLIQTSLRNQNS